MDSFYGPTKCPVDTIFNTFRSARTPAARGPAFAGVHAIKPNGILAALANPQNFTPEARLQRKKDRPEEWLYKNYVENHIFKVADRSSDFKTLTKDNRGLEPEQWIYNNAIDDELDRQRAKCEFLDVFILTTDQAVIAADGRVEYADEFDLSGEMLSKRFWIFPQGNIQASTHIDSPDFELIVNTLEGENKRPSSFKTTSNSIAIDLQGFLIQIYNLMPDRENDSNIWWTTDDLAHDPQTVRRHSLPVESFLGPDFLPWLGVASQDVKRVIWVGTSGSGYSYPVRPVTKYTESPNSHWWMTVIDSVTGKAYVHDSLKRGANRSKTKKLVENLNWFLKAHYPALKEIPSIRASGKAPFAPIPSPILCSTAKQQTNGFDCGIFVLGNVAGFVNLLERGYDDEKICEEVLISEEWTADGLRKQLLDLKKPVGQTNTFTIILRPEINPLISLLQMIKARKSDVETWAEVDARLNEYPKAQFADAFWHLDNAGAILISYKDIDLRPADAGSPMSPDTSEVTLVPVPMGHKIVLQR